MHIRSAWISSDVDLLACSVSILLNPDLQPLLQQRRAELAGAKVDVGEPGKQEESVN